MMMPLIATTERARGSLLFVFCAVLTVVPSASTACGREKTLTLALPTSDWWTAAPFVTPGGVAAVKDSAININILEVASGLASKNAVVAGTADIGIAAATPLAFAAANGEPLIILASYLRSSAVVGLVRPKGSSNGTVPEEPIAYVKSTISESFLYQFLAHAGPGQSPAAAPLLLEQRPPDIPTALSSGAAKSAVIWEPFLTLAASQPNLQRDLTPIAFEVNLYVITRRSTYEQRPAELEAFLKGVSASCLWLTSNPESARTALENRFGFAPGFLTDSFSQVKYGVSLDRTRAEAEILREARVQQRGRTGALPDLSSFFAPGRQR